MRDFSRDNLMKKALYYMRYGFCFKCEGYQYPRENKKLKKCSCKYMELKDACYGPYQWLDYCKNYNLDIRTGRKK